MNISIKLMSISLLIIILFSCQKPKEKLILVSKDSHSNIEHWLKAIDTDINIRVFYDIPKDSMLYFLKQASGIIIGGGEDVNPLQYNKPEYVSVCEAPDNFRDSIEILMIDFAMQNKISLLGICRGQQIINVAGGGTLIPDIPSFKPQSKIAHRFANDSAHQILIVNNSWLEKQIKHNITWVNSHHHQAVGEIAPNFKVSAYAPDSIIESIEIKDKNIHPFAIGIQWHPETLNDNLSKQIGVLFLSKLKE